MAGMTMADELRGFGLGEVVDDPAALDTLSRDASLFAIQPALAVHPRTSSDVQTLVRWASRRRAAGVDVSLTARAAGTDMSGGPLSASVVVGFTAHLNRLKSISGDSAVVEPGMYYRDFEQATLAHHRLLPSYPASRELCTVGGMVANNSGGEKTLRYGKTNRYVKKLKMVVDNGNEYSFAALSPAELAAKKKQPDREGEMYRQMHELLTTHADTIERARPTVSKNSSGYALWDVIDPQRQTFDLTQLITGSQGTLGLITEITFQLVQPQNEAALLVIFLDNLQRLGEVIPRVF